MAAVRLGFPRLLAAFTEFSRFSDLLPSVDSELPPAARPLVGPPTPSVVSSSSSHGERVSHQAVVGLTAALPSLNHGIWGDISAFPVEHSIFTSSGLAVGCFFGDYPLGDSPASSSVRNCIDVTVLCPESGGGASSDVVDAMVSNFYMLLCKTLISNCPDEGLLALLPVSKIDGVCSGVDAPEDEKEQNPNADPKVAAPGPGGVVGGGDDDDNGDNVEKCIIVKLVRMLLELCLQSEVDIDKLQFSPEFELLKQWHKLHLKRIFLKAASNALESDKEAIAREWQKVESELKKIDQMLSDLAKEKELVMRAGTVSRRVCRFNGNGIPVCKFDDQRMYLLLKKVLDALKPKDETPGPDSWTRQLKAVFQRVSKVMAVGGKLSPIVVAIWFYYATGLTRADLYRYLQLTFYLSNRQFRKDFDEKMKALLEEKKKAEFEDEKERLGASELEKNLSRGAEEEKTTTVEKKLPPGAEEEKTTPVEKKLSPGSEEEKTTPVEKLSPGAEEKKSTPVEKKLPPGAEEEKSTPVEKLSPGAEEEKSTPVEKKLSPGAEEESTPGEKKLSPGAEEEKSNPGVVDEVKRSKPAVDDKLDEVKTDPADVSTKRSFWPFGRK